MNYNIKYLLILLFIFGCATPNFKNQETKLKNKFENTGFSLIYDEQHYRNKIVSKKLNERDLLIFQKYLKKGTRVKITNLINQKSIVGTVSNNSKYPGFYNSVISKRIANELELSIEEPYTKIEMLSKNFTFIAKKTKTFDQEKNVANKAPVKEISINNLNNNEKNNNSKKKSENDFNYIIKIADFYYKKSAKEMSNKINNDMNLKNVEIRTISDTQYRVYLGPFKNINSLKKAFNDISILNFENIEILKDE